MQEKKREKEEELENVLDFKPQSQFYFPPGQQHCVQFAARQQRSESKVYFSPTLQN